MELHAGRNQGGGGGGEKQLIDLEWPNLPAGSDRVRLLYCRHNWV